uniref:G-protein coupled receptors family 1 profile domain-containing protein n=1 Tax=Plectus sambesii TaxID=2011161 RepID=A0A914V0K6_9BILA
MADANSSTPEVIVFLTHIAPYTLIVISIISLVGNGTILLVVAKNASLRQKDCLYLIAALAVADFLTAAGTIPYALNIAINDNINCTVGSIFWSVAGNVSGVRMNQICTLFLAIDRIYALFQPFAYYAKNHLKIAQFVIFISFLWSASEMASNIFGADLSEAKTSCTTTVAFPNGFRIYRIFSSVVLNIGTQLLYVVVFWKLRSLKADSKLPQDSKDRLQQANTTVSILFLTSMIFMVLPSIWSVYSFFVQTVKLGPIFGIFACLNGAINVFIYGWKHKDFKAAIKTTFGRKTNQIRTEQEHN